MAIPNQPIYEVCRDDGTLRMGGNEDNIRGVDIVDPLLGRQQVLVDPGRCGARLDQSTALSENNLTFPLSEILCHLPPKGSLSLWRT